MVRVDFHAESQEEFDAKRSEIVKALIGSNPIAPRQGYYRFQNEMLDYFNSRFDAHVDEIKKEIANILKRKLL